MRKHILFYIGILSFAMIAATLYWVQTPKIGPLGDTLSMPISFWISIGSSIIIGCCALLLSLQLSKQEKK